MFKGSIPLDDLIYIVDTTPVEDIKDPALLIFAKNRDYLQIKNEVRHEPLDTLTKVQTSPIQKTLNQVHELIKTKDIYLTGSWFLGNYFYKTDPPTYLDHREALNKPRFSDIDLWSENYSEELRSIIKSVKFDHKVDLISGWWGYGINLSTGKVKRCINQTLTSNNNKL